MTTTRGEIGRGESGRLNEQLAGQVWLAQRKAEWPVQVLTSTSEVETWMKQNPDGAVWEYDIKPVSRVEIVRPEPFLQRVPVIHPSIEAPIGRPI